MSNLEIREFSQTIINFVNKSPLPVEVKRLVMTDILNQIDSAANTAIHGEIAERVRKEKEDQDNVTEQAVQQD